jgi:spoIIIJ-associated protein
MSSKRFEGKNLEEALDSAARTLGVERYRLSYHVVLEKRGFLGGTKRVVVEADVNDAVGGSGEKSEPRQSSKRRSRGKEHGDAPKREEVAAPVESRVESSIESRVVLTEEPSAEGTSSGRTPRRRGRRRGKGASRGEAGGKREGRTDESGPAAERSVEVPEQGPRSDDAAAAAEWCERVIELAGLDLEVRTVERDEEVIVELYGPDTPKLQASGGELLDSMQVLVNKALVGRSVERRIELDVEGFKSRRAEDLTRRALELAAKVREEGRERTLPAMTPIERRIIHLALEDEEGVETESRGRGFHKRVAIVPTGDEGAVARES